MQRIVKLFFLGVLGALIANSAVAQNTADNSKLSSGSVSRDIAKLAGHSDQVCFSTCKYKGDSGTYLGLSDKDDENCSTACGKALKACNDASDTNCNYVKDSCKYTNCS